MTNFIKVISRQDIKRWCFWYFAKQLNIASRIIQKSPQKSFILSSYCLSRLSNLYPSFQKWGEDLQLLLDIMQHAAQFWERTANVTWGELSDLRTRMLEWQEIMQCVIMQLGTNTKYFLLEAGDSSFGKNRTEVSKVLQLGNGLVCTNPKLYWGKLEEN